MTDLDSGEEYFKAYNRGVGTVNLKYWIVLDVRLPKYFVIADDAWIGPGQYTITGQPFAASEVFGMAGEFFVYSIGKW
jgi:hypothetical protein